MNLTLNENEYFNPQLSYFSYDRFQIHIKANKLFESFKEQGYFFPRNLFLKYDLGELRNLIVNIYESWCIINIDERKKILFLSLQ